MKKRTLLFGTALICGLVAISPKISAQITLDQSDLPSAGLTVITDEDSTSLPAAGSASSSTQAWDFSALAKKNSATTAFVDASATSYSSVAAFSGANLADSTYGGNGYTFFNTGASAFSVEGAEEIQTVQGYSFHIEAELSPVFVQSNLPATYSSVVAPGVSRGSEAFNESLAGGLISQEKFTTTIEYSDTVDAFGTMKMPSGKTYGVLRQKHHEVDYDSAFIYGTYTGNQWVLAENTKTFKNQYDWYAKGVGYILSEMDMDSAFTTPIDVIWDTNAPDPVSTGIVTLSNKNNVNAYPNPASNQITFNTLGASGNENQSIAVYDMAGRKLEQVAVKNNVTILNTAAYSSGMYLYELKDNSGNIIDQGKFIVQH